MDCNKAHCDRWAIAWNAFGQRWHGHSCKGNALAGASVGLLLAASDYELSDQADQAPPTTVRSSINGTIAKIAKNDAPVMRLRMQSERGQYMSLALANVEAVRAGDHVRIDVETGGNALNVNTTTVTPQPTSHSRG